MRAKRHARERRLQLRVEALEGAPGLGGRCPALGEALRRNHDVDERQEAVETGQDGFHIDCGDDARLTRHRCRSHRGLDVVAVDEQ